MPVSRFLDFTVPALLALLLGAGVYAGWLEGRSFLSAPGDAPQRFAAIAEGRPSAGLSSYSARYLLADCGSALAGPYGRLQPEESRARAADFCRDAALEIIDASPLNGLAYAVAGRASAVLEQPEEAISFLLRSAEAAPYEAWLAHQRILITQEWRLDEDARMATVHRRDLGVLGRTFEGSEWLARWYVFAPDRREMIVSIVDGLEDRYKRAFLDAVRAANAAR